MSRGTTADIDWKRLVFAILISIFLPGLGHALYGRWLRMAVWLALIPLSMLIVPYWVYALHFYFIGARVVVIPEVFFLALRTEPPPDALTALVVIGCVLAGNCGTRELVRTYHSETMLVTVADMAPTITVGDNIYYKKYKTPDVGDVVVFHHPCPERGKDVKRIVAKAGDTVELRCDSLYINDEPVAATELGDFEYLKFIPPADENADSRFLSVSAKKVAERARHGSYRTLRNPSVLGEIKGTDAPPPEAEKTSEAAKAEGNSEVGSDEKTPSDVDKSEGLPAVDFARDDFPARGSSNPPEFACANLSRQLRDPGEYLATGVPSATDDKCQSSRAYKVPAGHVFVLGDNRYDTNDSRHWGPLPVDAIDGVAFTVWWSANPPQGWRWRRIGTDIE